MVSALTFDKVVQIYGDHLRAIGSKDDARSALLDFLDWSEPYEDRFAQSVRIVLAFAEFSKELTTSVMWLNKNGLDIRCVRIEPYRDGGRVLVDVPQVIRKPLTASLRSKRKKCARPVLADRFACLSKRFGPPVASTRRYSFCVAAIIGSIRLCRRYSSPHSRFRIALLVSPGWKVQFNAVAIFNKIDSIDTKESS